MLLLFVSAGIATAQERIVTDVRQHAQRARIRGGAASGELTRQETHRLRREQRHIRRTERRMKADGVVTPSENARLTRRQNRANRDIRRQKHDAQQRLQ